MSVSFQKIIQQMKKEINSIDAQTSDETIKGKMHSIQSLAALITDSETVGEPPVGQAFNHQPTSNQPQNFSMEEAEAKVMGIDPSKVSGRKRVDEGERLKEDDANGDSIFDF